MSPHVAIAMADGDTTPSGTAAPTTTATTTNENGSEQNHIDGEGGEKSGIERIGLQGANTFNQYNPTCPDQLSSMTVHPILGNVLAQPHRAITPPLVGSSLPPFPSNFAPVPGGHVVAPTILPANVGEAMQQFAMRQAVFPQAPHSQSIMPSAQAAGPHNLVPVHLQHLLLSPGVGASVPGPYAMGLASSPTYLHNLIPPSMQAAALAHQRHLAQLHQHLQPALIALDMPPSFLVHGPAAPTSAAAAAAALTLAMGTQPSPVPTLHSALHAQQILGAFPQCPPRPIAGSDWGMPTGPALCVQDLPPSALPPIFNGVNPAYPGLRIVHSDPPVFAVDNFLTAQECAFLISAACDSFGPAPVVGKGAGEISSSRTSSTCYLAREDLWEYLGKVSCLTGKPVRHCELPQVGRYLPSQQYLQHFDAFDLSTEDGRRFASNGGQRTVTVLVYLNDVEKGGATSFPALGLNVQPRLGTALIFFPATLDGYLDKRALHAALPAVDVKYVSQVWIRQGDYDGLPSKRLGRDREAAVREAARLTSGGI